MDKIELILVVYPDPDRAPELQKQLQHEIRNHGLHVLNAAAISTPVDEPPRINDAFDVGIGRGSVFGAIVGGLVGLLGGPAGAVVGAMAGAATGGLVAGGTDVGFDEKFLVEVQDALQPGTSALLLMVDQSYADRVVQMAGGPGVRLIRNLLKDELVQRLRGGEQR